MGQVEAIHEFVTGLNAEGRAILETQMSYRTEHGSGTTAPTAPLNDLEKAVLAAGNTGNRAE